METFRIVGRKNEQKRLILENDELTKAIDTGRPYQAASTPGRPAPASPTVELPPRLPSLLVDTFR